MRRTLGVVAAALVLVATAACSGDDGEASERGRDSTTTSIAIAAASSPSSSGGTGTGGGCPANGGAVPPGAVSAETIDVDRDGQPDRAWYSFDASAEGGAHRVGLATASGAVLGRHIGTAKGVRGVVVVNADDRGPVEVLVTDGATGFLYVFLDCDLVPVIGPDDAPYLFDLGYRGNGTGAICADADGDGRRDLVGVNYVDNRDGSATLSRTVIELDGASASHGHDDEQAVPATGGYSGFGCGAYAISR